MPEQHASLGKGGSVASRTLNCPGWVPLTLTLPPELQHPPASQFAIEGTKLHEEMEEILLNNARPTHEKTDRALDAFDLVCEELGVQDEEFMVEQRVQLKGFEGYWGTCDIVIDARPIVILDWKFGDGVMVFAENNDQLQFYANAALDTLFDPHAIRPSDEVVLAIVQPSDRREQDYDYWRTTVGDLRSWKARYAAAVKQTHIELGSWCKFCPALAICPKQRCEAEKALQTNLAELQPEALGEWWSKARFLEDFIRELDRIVLYQLEREVEIPGCKLVRGKTQRAWEDSKATLAWIKAQRLPLKDFAPRTPVTPAAMERQNVEFPDELLKKKTGKLVIAPELDPRPAVNLGLQRVADMMKATSGKKN